MGDSDSTPPTATNVSTTTNEATATKTTTPPPVADYAILRTSVIDAVDFDEGFEAPSLEQIVIGRAISILYEVEVPVQDGEYKAVVYVGLSEYQGNFNSMEFFHHEGSADGETARIVGHTPPQPTDDFVAGELGVDVHVGEEMNDSVDEEHFVVQVVTPTEAGNTDN